MSPKKQKHNTSRITDGIFFLNKPALLLLQYTTTTRYNYYNYNIKKTHLQQHLIKRQQLSHQLHYKNTKYILTLQNIIKNCCTSSYYYNYHYNY